MTALGDQSVVTGAIWPTPPGPAPVATTPRLSVAIPAHDEASVIGRCLDVLLGGLADQGLDHRHIELAVVCNGCRDHTAHTARRHLGPLGLRHHRVLELPLASKPAALRLADAVLTTFPRLYLDADVEMTLRTALDVAAALGRPGVLAARPLAVVDTTGAGPAARRHARARARLDELQTHLWGAGVYGVSAEGHRRLGTHPDVTADDLWVDTHFATHERCIVDTEPVVVRAPRNLAGVLAVARRAQRGRRELGPDAPATTGATARAVIRTAASAPLDAALYASVAAWSHAAARRAVRHRGHARWERDRSTR